MTESFAAGVKLLVDAARQPQRDEPLPKHADPIAGQLKLCYQGMTADEKQAADEIADVLRRIGGSQ